MNDFQKFAIALNDFQLDIEDEKQMESLYEKIKDLDCYDFRIFYLKAYHCYKKLGNPEEARAHIDKSIEAIPLIKEDIFSSVENSRFICVPLGNSISVPVAGVTNKLMSNIYTLAGEIYSILELDNEALEYYKRALYYKTLLKTDIEKEDYVYLYSFRRFNDYSKDDLINNKITVSPSKKMNDPFDSIINLWGSDEQLKETCKEHKHIKNLSRSFDYFRIRSFCNGETEEALENLLMWSHYADEHRGYCIKYKLSKHFIKQDENDSFEHMFLKPIIYRKDEEKVDISGMTSINTDLAFATKHESWKYEKEVRLIVFNPNKEESFYGIPLDKDSCIEAIYFGCKCSRNTKNTIMKLFSHVETSPKFYEMYSDSNNIYQLKWKMLNN
ncbi:DUF2971 domain-containing protein [Parabacteroides distasonis]|nr:DUF2971 domain-containing protein [Parabacteroides distasonis]